MWQYNYSSDLAHHGVIGMKWGKRRENKVNILSKQSHSASSAYEQYKQNVEDAEKSHRKYFTKEQHDRYMKQAFLTQTREIDRLKIDSDWRKRRVNTYINKLSKQYNIHQNADGSYFLKEK